MTRASNAAGCCFAGSMSSGRIQQGHAASSDADMKNVVAQPGKPLLRSFRGEQEPEKPTIAKTAPIRTEEEQEHQRLKWCSITRPTHISTTARRTMSTRIHKQAWMALSTARLLLFSARLTRATTTPITAPSRGCRFDGRGSNGTGRGEGVEQ